jgi:hypothetical protein
MLQPVAKVHLSWRDGVALDESLRARLARECELISWPLSEMEALLHDAHRVTGLDHAYLLPRIELRLPLYDLARRYRVVLTLVDKVRIALVDEDGRRAADILLL